MTYVSQYSSSDLSPVTFDVIVSIGVAFISLSILIAILLIAKWYRGR